jgi:SAM-dependent methyltransferase
VGGERPLDGQEAGDEVTEQDYDFLLANAQAGKVLGLANFLHLDQPIGIRSYIRIADDIARQVAPCDLLDWGCGWGQMTYLLRRRGFRVTPFDVEDAGSGERPDLPLSREVDVIVTTERTTLPFPDSSFAAVLSCGVLEHVDEFSQPGNERKSLDEIARVLRPDGLLLIYQLPQRYAWQEALSRRLRLGYAHPRRFTAREATTLLRQTGFSIERMRRTNLIPRNLTGMPGSLRTMYSRFSKPLIALDEVLCKLPGLSHVAGALEITARRDSRRMPGSAEGLPSD